MQPDASASATPILDLIEPLPSRPATRVRYVLLGFLLGLMGTGVLIALDQGQWADSSNPLFSLVRIGGLALRFWDDQFLLGGLVALWTAFLVSVVIHELGHFLVGRAVGLRLQSLQIGPVRISFEFGNLRIRIIPAAVMGGFAAMHIRTFSRLRRKLAKFVFAGPGTNLLCAIVALTLVWIPGALSSMYMWSALSLFGFVSLFCCVITLLPIRARGGFFTDGTRLLMLLRPNKETLRWYAIMGIGMQQLAGRRARGWNRRWLALASSISDDSRDGFLGTYTAYAAASDRKDEPVAASCLERCLRSLPPPQIPLRDIVVTEAGFFQAWFRQDAEKANAWFARVKRPGGLSPILRVRAEIARQFVRGEFNAAYAEWSKGLTLIEGFRDAIQREMVRQSWLEWKQEMDDRQRTRAPAFAET